MSVTSGFFNSINHDRRYNASQMSAIFDGIINDGVFANIGEAFKVTVDSGVTINIAKGRAWFNSAWIYNDAPLPMTLEGSEVVLDRIDAVVIEVDHNENVRLGDIKIVKGTPSSSPTRPKMANEQYKHQYPLAYILRKAGSTKITQGNITNMVGTSKCPYITGILQVQNIDNIVAQWNAQWNEWYADKVAETDSDASVLLAEMQSEFDIWFNDFKSVLDEDTATSLAAQIADLMGKFDDLAREGHVYDTIEDSDLDEILGSDGTPIQGKTVFSSDGGANVSKPSDIGAVAVDGTTPMEGALDMNNHRIQNVVTPEADTDVANVAYVKDAAAQIADLASRFSAPRNLLDNSDFTNPVNQRGIASQTGSKYGIDAWSGGTSNSSIAIGDGFVTFGNTSDNSSNIRQFLEIDQIKPYGKTFTIACEDADGNIYCGSGTAPASTPTSSSATNICAVSGIPGVQVRCRVDNLDNLFAQVYTEKQKQISLKWIALYEGAYTLDTLPQYQPKGYAAELWACQRYLQRFATSGERKTNCEDFRPTMRMTDAGTVSTFDQVVDGVTYYFASAEMSEKKTT